MSPKIDGGRIVSWSGSEASNAIPSQSICELSIAADELPAPVENADRLEITALDNGHAQISPTVLAATLRCLRAPSTPSA